MTRAKIERLYESVDGHEPMLLITGFDSAFVGMKIEFPDPVLSKIPLDAVYCAVYSANECITLLAREMSHDEAAEYFWFNVAPGYVGQGAPLFIYTP